MQPATRSLIRNRNFILLWCAYGISATGDHLSEFAILAHQNALSPDIDVTPLQARMTFLFMLPFFLFGPITGWVADRFPRRWVMIFADVMRVGIMLSFLVLIDRFGEMWPGWGPFIPLGLVGVFAALFGPSRASLVPTLVGRKELVSANAMIAGLGMIATMFAAGAGGYLAERGYVQTAFNLDAGTFVLSAILVFMISSRRSSTPKHLTVDREPFLKNLAGGIRYLSGHRRVVQLILIATVFWFSGATVRSVMPAIVKDVYHGGFQAMALFPVWLGIGLVTGSVLLTILGHAVRGEIAITWSLCGAGVGTMGLAASVFLPFSPGAAYVVGAFSVFVMGVFGAGVGASYNALIQRFVPNQYRGRVYGLVNVSTVGGLLLATGALAIPPWRNLDQWAGYILLVVAALMVLTGIATFVSRQRRNPLGALYVFHCSVNEVIAKFWWRLDAPSRCTIPRTGPVIITANHSCFLDPLFFYAMCRYRRISFMVAAEYFKIPMVGHLLRASGSIPVRRDENDIGAIKEALRRLKRGELIGLFIQGGIRHENSEENLKNGVAMLALRTGAQVIPAYINGTTHSSNIMKTIVTRHHARIVLGPAVELSDLAGRRGQEVLATATGRIYEAIISLAPENDNAAPAP